MRINSVSIDALLGFQFSKINTLEASFPKPISVIMGSNGSGKAQPYTSPIATPTGFVPLYTLQQGAELLAVDGSVMHLVERYDRGILPVFKCIFEDGRNTLCAGDHLWQIRDYADDTETVIDTVSLFKQWRHTNQNASYRFGIPLFKPYKTIELHKTQSPLFSTAFRYVRWVLDTFPSTMHHGIFDCKIPDKGVIHECIRALRIVGAVARYIVDERVVRFTHPLPQCLFPDTTVSYPCDDRMTLGLKQIIPFGHYPCMCIYVDHPSHLYLTDDYIVTHNTTLMNALVPTPAVRSDYLKHGKKTLQLDHHGESYTLSTDFSNKTAPHTFLKGDVNLNESGVTGVQTELIEKHLGYNQTIQDLITMKTNVCSMGPSERKTFFLNNNPVDLRFILEKHKRIIGKIKEYKGNLSMLYGRKTEIAQKVLSPAVLKEMEKNKEHLQEQNIMLTKLLYALDIRIDQLKRENKDLFALEASLVAQGKALIPKSRILEYHKTIQHEAYKYQHVDRETLADDIQTLHYQERECLQRIQMVQEQALSLKKEIDEYQDRLNKVMRSQSQALERQYKDLEVAIKGVPHDPRLPVFSDEEKDTIASFYTSNTGLSLLQSLDERPQHILRPETYQRLRQHHYRRQQQLDHVMSRYQEIQERIGALEKEYEAQTASFPAGCLFPTCSLRETVDRRRAVLIDQLKTLKAQRHTAEQDRHRGRRVCTVLSRRCQDQASFQTQYQTFLQTYWRYTFLQKVCTIDDLFYYLSTEPRKLIQRIELSVTNTTNAALRDQLCRQKQAVEKEIAVLLRENLTSEQFINDVLKEKSQQLKLALDHMATAEKDLQSIRKTLTDHQQLKQYQLEGESLTKQFNEGVSIYLLKKMIEICEWTRGVFIDQQNETQEKLRNLESTLKEQHALSARLNDEILSNIESIEKVKWQYELVEKVLSPGTGLPHQYTISYLNTLIHNVNYFISRIMTYPLVVLPLETSESIDFVFPVQVEDVVVRDISRLSKGQQEVVTLAWNLAILLQKQSLDQYPIFLDEIGTGLDTGHAQRLMSFLHELVQSGTVPQIFLVNHNQSLTSDDGDTETFCLRTENVILPEVYNQHLSIQ